MEKLSVSLQSEMRNKLWMQFTLFIENQNNECHMEYSLFLWWTQFGTFTNNGANWEYDHMIKPSRVVKTHRYSNFKGK